MTALSVFSHEREPTVDPKPGSMSALGHSRPEHETWRVDASSRAAADELPPVLLQLPDLAEVEQEIAVRPARIADQVFWVALVLGALLALTLIWTGKKPPVLPADEAPAWQGETNASQTGSKETPRERAHSAWSGIELPRPSDLDSANPRSEGRPAQEGVPQDRAARDSATENSAAPLDYRDQGSSQMPSESELAAPPIHTARSADSGWGGSAPTMNPGEAAPVGTIINTPVAP